MAPTKPTSTKPAQTTARTSTRCSTRIFFTLASRSGTTRIVYDLSRRASVKKCRDLRGPLSSQPPGRAPPSRLRAQNPGGPGLVRKLGAPPGARKLASTIGLRETRQLVHNGWRVRDHLTHFHVVAPIATHPLPSSDRPLRTPTRCARLR